MTKKKHYPEVVSNVDFPEIENQILKFWQENNIFQKSIDNRNSGSAKSNRLLSKHASGRQVLGAYGTQNRSVLGVREDSSTGATTQLSAEVEFGKKSNEFVFYDGPPFANGLPHYGHLLTGFVKDTYARYQTSCGKKVERRFGWDCHGLPAEMGAEKELGFSGRAAISEYGIDKFNDHCRSSVMKYSHNWERYVNRQARWVDFKNSYKTMDIGFMESVLWAFSELYKKGLIYEGLRVMPYSWACETPLSNFETRLDNSYRERADKAITVSFKLNKQPEGAPKGCSEYLILAWTTTPWTLPSNLALAVNSEMDYACVVKDNICYIISSSAIKNYAKELGVSEESELVAIKGSDLEGISYQPIFDYFKNHPKSFKILTADFVSDGDGTGVVHLAPGFGEDDQLVCDKEGIELVCPVDMRGKFTNEVPDFEGIQVFDSNDSIIIKLKNQGNWIKTEQYIHNYPHCWRTDTPLIYKAVPSWYVKVTEFKDRMVELNQQINWIPNHIKNGLFGKWLENARDWSISRNRFWGTPIPVWKSDDPKYPRIDVYGSIKDLEKDFGVKVDDLHKPFIDNLTRPNPDDPSGKSKMIRVSDVFDCWFESGSMPYAQVHYPFENKEWFNSHFPADFIVEYSAQTRGWFYTLMVLSTALFDRPPFLNCICHGVILDATGQKLSKRLNNYADPLDLFEKYGADALRVTMLGSSVVRGQELLIDKDGKMVFDSLRLFIKPIWNAYHFFCLYANIDQIQAQLNFKSQNVLDKYIISKLKLAVVAIRKNMDSYDSQSAYEAVSSFFEVLNNWYIRRSRARFWKSDQDQDKLDAYNTLYSCILTMTKAMCSLLPLISEHIYLGLNQSEESVHLCDFPVLDEVEIEHNLVVTMDQVLDICSTALFIRSTENIRVRQPLNDLTITLDGVSESTYHNYIKPFEDLIKDEINVKNIIYESDVTKFADYKLSINFPILGKRLPDKVKYIIKGSKEGDWFEVAGKISVAGIDLLPEECKLTLEPKKDIKGVATLSGSTGLVILNLETSEELRGEGIARDIIRLVQQARKEAEFDVSDRIKLELKCEYDLSEVINIHGKLISEQTLSHFESGFIPDYKTQAPLLDHVVEITIKKL